MRPTNGAFWKPSLSGRSIHFDPTYVGCDVIFAEGSGFPENE
jgi:hypothetical protein